MLGRVVASFIVLTLYGGEPVELQPLIIRSRTMQTITHLRQHGQLIVNIELPDTVEEPDHVAEIVLRVHRPNQRVKILHVDIEM